MNDVVQSTKRTWSMLRAAGAVLAAMGLALLPIPAAAHGIGGEAAHLSVWGFIPLGIEHMLLGWDHILFIGGVVLLAGEWRKAVKLITIFVIGHSTTLITATLAGWQVSAEFVDVIIALSVVFVGAVGIIGRPARWDLFGAIVFAFGLIHGLGLSTRLQELGLPEEGILLRVIAFNVGVEIGQLTAIVAIVALAAIASMLLGRGREAMLQKVASAALFLGGTVAASVVAYQAFTGTQVQPTAVAVEDTSGCNVSERTETFPVGGGHTAKNFYEPTEEAPLGDFGHSLGDGYVVVLYPPSLEDAALTDLRSFVTGPQGQGVLAGPSSPPVQQVKAINAYETLTCEDLEMEALEEFTSTWFESLQQ